jgi:hypothetical protein
MGPDAGIPRFQPRLSFHPGSGTGEVRNGASTVAAGRVAGSLVCGLTRAFAWIV